MCLPKSSHAEYVLTFKQSTDFKLPYNNSGSSEVKPGVVMDRNRHTEEVFKPFSQDDPLGHRVRGSTLVSCPNLNDSCISD